MSHAALNTLVESRFATVWGATTPIAYEGVDFSPTAGSSWVAIKVREGSSRKITLGSGAQVRRTIGTIFVETYAPLGQGSKPTRDLVDAVKVVFRDYRASGFHAFEASAQVIGPEYYTNSGTGVPATSQQYQAIVAVPFRYDEVI